MELSESNSKEKNNVINDLNRIYETISSVGKFKDNYDDMLNVISALNQRMSQYSALSHNSIKCDVIDNVISAINFDELGTAFTKKINDGTQPVVGLQWTPINFSISEIDLSPYQLDEIEAMRMTISKGNTKSKKRELKNLMDCQSRAITYLRDYLNDFNYFENNLQRRRDAITTALLNNVPFLVNEHYKIAYKSMISGNKNTPPESITFEDITIPFTPKLKDFVKGAINSLCEQFIK